MFERDKRKMAEYSKREILKSAQHYFEKSQPVTTGELLEYMLGDDEGYETGAYIVYKYRDNNNDRSFIHRFNILWVTPIFYLTIPFQYLFLGNIGLNRKNKIGKLVNYLTKIF